MQRYRRIFTIGRRSIVACMLGAWLLVWLDVAGATSIRQASVSELAERSAVIFQGSVVEARTRRNAHGAIVTDVVFEIQDVIKGRIPQRRLTLEFLGGRVADERLEIPGMSYPEPGETGIYFAESINRVLVNPLYGWDQGRFLVEPDGKGVQRVHTAGRRPVQDITAGDSVFFAAPAGPARLSDGVADGVRTAPAAAPLDSSAGLTAAQFKQRIRNLLGTAP